MSLVFLAAPGILQAQTQITTWAELYNVRNNLDANYVLMNNLDQDSPGYDTYAGSSANSDAGWEPIGTESTPFTGEFDGQEFSITGLTISRPGTNYLGLFGATNSAVIANIHLLELEITGNSDVAGLIGNIDGGSVTNSSASGSVTASSDVGGLVGQNVSATISKSFTSVEVIASGSAVGGLVGRFQGFGSSVSESYATGDVEGGVSVGGLVGSVSTFGSVNDSYATGEASGLTNVGGLAGSVTGISGFGGIHRSYATGFVSVTGSYAGGLIGNIASVSVSNSYWNTDTSGRDNAVGNGSSSGITGRTDEEMRQQASFSGFDFSTLWQIEEDVWYPVLRNNTQDIPGETEIPVSTLEIPVHEAERVSLNPTFDWNTSDNVDSFELELSKTSDFSVFFRKFTRFSESSYTLSSEKLEPDTQYYWRVRSVDNEKTGEWSDTFSFRTIPFVNGNGSESNPWEVATAKQLNAIRYYLDKYYIQTADIDLTTATGNASGAYWNGGKGWDPIGEYENPFTGTFEGGGFIITGLYIDRPGEDEIGLFGETGSTSELLNIGLMDVSILDGRNRTGGLVGRNRGEITNSYTTGTILTSSGGLTGDNHGTIRNSYSTVSVSGSGQGGGLIRYNSGEIYDSYATGDVEGDFNVGGLVGVNFGDIYDSYATGEVDGSDTVGGFVGYNYSSITTSYWNTEASGTTTGVGDGSSTGVAGLTTKQMRQQASFSGFDFTNTWQIKSGTYTSYPYLQSITYDEPGTVPEKNPIPGLYRLSPDGNNILYVDQNVSGGNETGNSWANAVPELRDALAWAQDWGGDADGTLKIWVADGLYLPTSDELDRSATFRLVNDVEVYGGFDGGESNLEDRDWSENLTILSGDIGGDDTITNGVVSDTDNISGNNSYHVVTGSGTDETALLDGFTLTAGNADGSGENSIGGGMVNDNGSPTLTHVTFSGNSAFYAGGGMYNEDSSPTLTHAIFSGNSAGYGGGMYNWSSNPTLTNLTFSGNSAEYSGAGMYNRSSSPTLTHVIFSGNLASSEGGGMSNADSSNPTLTNVIIWDNQAGGSRTSASASIDNNYSSTPEISHSLIANSGGSTNWNSDFGTDGGNNIDVDPQFNDPANGDYTLMSTSPAINAGTNAPFESGGVAEGITTDMAGNPRIYDGQVDIVDIGAYEFQGDPVIIPDAVVLSSPADEAVNVVLQPTFSWQVLDNVDDYQLQVSENSDLTSPTIDQTELAENSFQPSGDFDYSTTYYWRVRASNAAGNGQWSEIFSFTTIPEESAVVILASPADEATDVELNPLFQWTAAENADTHDIIVSPNSDFSDPVIDKQDISSTEYQTETNLSPATMYYWRVRGVNSGGTGEWSEVFSFTTLLRPEASDQRLLVSNASDYLFSGMDFGVAENGYSIKISSLPAEGTLEFDGSPVTANDEIPVEDINNNLLTWSPPAGQYGYGFTSFDFSIIDDNELESEQAYTMTLDLGTHSVKLTGGEGWRFLGNPSDGDSYDDFLDPIWTKGIPGSDSPTATFSNVFEIDGKKYAWEAPNTLEKSMFPGQPFIVYVYSDDDNDGNPEGFPKTLTSGTDWLPLMGVHSFSAFGFNENEDNPYNFYLIANPHPIAINFCEAWDETAVNLANSIVFWDPSANESNGDYVSPSCSLEEVEIAPFQAFWVQAVGENASLGIPESAYMEEPAMGYFKSNLADDLFDLSLNVTHQNEKFSQSARILFSDEASENQDAYDTMKLSPAGLAKNWLSFYSVDKNARQYALQSLPTGFNEKLRIPLDIQTTQAGSFTLDWDLPESRIFNGQYFLRDNETSEVIELKNGVEYSFEIAEDQAEKTTGNSVDEFPFPLSERSKGSDGSTPRFELLIAQPGIDGFTELGAIPENFELGQNYPNPFNPTTVINYQLPVTSEVRLDVYDMLGRNVATLVSGQVAAGWHTVTFDASGLSSGVYLYRLAAGSQIITRKLTVVK